MLGLGGGSQGAPAQDLVFDATDASFMADVIEASRETPVIVDFWAPWCGPCRTLGPELEKAVQAKAGKVKLAKVDIDQNKMVAGQLGVKSIPAVYAFVNGQPVDGFMGALPGSQIEAFINQIVQAAGGDAQALDAEALLEASEKALAEGAVTEALQGFGAVLQNDPSELKAIGGLSRCYLAAGDIESAAQVLESAPEDKQDDPAIASARSAIALARETEGAAEKAAQAAAALEADPNNHQARYDLALAHVAAGRREEAVDELLEIFRRDRTWNEEAAKTQLLKLFEAFGPTDPLTLSARRRLSSMVFA